MEATDARGAGKKKNGRWLIAALVAWVVVISGGFFSLWRYKAEASAEPQGAPSRWPRESRLAPVADRATLVLFAHPRCACTHASITELARLMGRMNGTLAGRVSIVKPGGIDAAWDDTELVARASAIPGVTVSIDEGGVEAGRFGAVASGHTVVYDAGGRRLFSGGLTSSRGHEGESFGSRRIVSLLTTGVADRADAPIFGCALAGPMASMEESTR